MKIIVLTIPQPSPESEQMKLRGGGGCCDVCCGWCVPQTNDNKKIGRSEC